MPEHGAQNAFKCKREHMVKVSILNIAYLNPHLDIQIPDGLRYNVFVPDARKSTFNLDNESIDKTQSTLKNLGSRRETASRQIIRNLFRGLWACKIDDLNHG